jgi:hypothetical protein
MNELKNFQFPSISEKNLAIVVLGIIAVASMYFLGVESLPVITGCTGAVGGFVMGRQIN